MDMTLAHAGYKAFARRYPDAGFTGWLLSNYAKPYLFIPANLHLAGCNAYNFFLSAKYNDEIDRIYALFKASQATVEVDYLPDDLQIATLKESTYRTNLLKLTRWEQWQQQISIEMPFEYVTTLPNQFVIHRIKTPRAALTVGRWANNCLMKLAEGLKERHGNLKNYYLPAIERGEMFYLAYPSGQFAALWYTANQTLSEVEGIKTKEIPEIVAKTLFDYFHSQGIRIIETDTINTKRLGLVNLGSGWTFPKIDGEPVRPQIPTNAQLRGPVTR